MLRIPYAGLTHPDRAVLASTLYVRQNGEMDDALLRPILGLLDAGQLSWIHVTGLALRLAHTISGSAPGLLSRTKLSMDSENLVLTVAEEDRVALLSESVERRLKTLARAMNLKASIA